ncbi:branched-chain amino acid ABC transporter permease [Phyllobacterium brassicacearum]|uniref:Branched-chain amino acid ABC transporter permease n=1 Tax=Phyllobacterium brassicacearum TaxID=314235 RepID=A0A2P7B3I3_9HYPH|nr:branched-chain amino acid ABC transporter permease [Phyllobacterium brassicacearum]PSH61008.1 branched-chain amino acid ABC transporter permease [Phyllobacterium brassicacearum]TDQ12860.1 amino acid/amide ABC transporter membrane protein 1 (HAAT family) [Phyllobacterium brassicacearum]
MAYFLQLLLNGIHNAALYALLAYGYVLIHGLTHRTDLSLGAIFAFSGQTFILVTAFAWSVLWMTLPAALSFGLLMAVVYVGVGGYAIAKLIYAPLEAGNRNTVLVATLGLSIFLMELSRIAANTRDYWLPPMLAAPVQVLGGGVDISLTQLQVVNIAVALAVIASGEAIMLRTSAGRIWRAVSDEPAATAMCGIDPARVRTQAILAGYGVCALAGLLAALYYGNVSFNTGMIFGLKILFITAAGGFSRPLHAAVGAAIVGMVESLWGGYFSVLWRDAAVFSMLVFVLATRINAQDAERI